MNHKKSMRIFWLSLCLLLISGAAIIAFVQYRSHKSNPQEEDGIYKNMDQALRNTDMETKTDADNADYADTAMPQTHGMHAEQSHAAAAQPAGGGTAEYRFEIKVKNGYLDVYHYHTENLFFHTGIPFGTLALPQRQELQDGKYFLSEQELYGYLESCTS